MYAAAGSATATDRARVYGGHIVPDLDTHEEHRKSKGYETIMSGGAAIVVYTRPNIPQF